MESNWSIEPSVSIHSGRFWPLRRVLACEKSRFASLLAFRFVWSILEKCFVHLRTSSSKTQMLLARGIYSTNIDCSVTDSSRLYWPLKPFVLFLSFVNNSWNNYVTTPFSNELLWPDSGQILRHQYGISLAESQMSSSRNVPSCEEREETAVFAG